MVEIQRVRVNLGASDSAFVLAAKAGHRSYLLGMYGSLVGNLAITSGGGSVWDETSRSSGTVESMIDLQPSGVPWVRSAAGAGIRFVTAAGSAAKGVALLYYLPEEGDNDIVT